MQIAMLYAKKGLPLEGDAYQLDGVDAGYRKLLKQTLLKMINATGRYEIPDEGSLPTGWTFHEVKQALTEKHSAISHYFQTGIGLELQRIDADIAMKVMLQFQAEDNLVLPVHDSFITYLGSERTLKEVMKQAYHERMRQEIGVPGDTSWVDQEFPREEFGDTDTEDYGLEDYVRDREEQPEYSDYLKRKREFLSAQSIEWQMRFRPE
jgi:hypothetical protein